MHPISDHNYVIGWGDLVAWQRDSECTNTHVEGVDWYNKTGKAFVALPSQYMSLCKFCILVKHNLNNRI